MTDQTITLTYVERAVLLTILALAKPEVFARYPEFLTTLSDIMIRVSRLECQPGGCQYCTGEDYDN